jgi:hypothetical protein
MLVPKTVRWLEELMLFSLIVSRSNSLVNISKVIVPRNFDAKVNELQGTLDYKSNRGIVALVFFIK